MDQKTLNDWARLLGGASPAALGIDKNELTSVATQFFSTVGLISKTGIILPVLPLGPTAVEIVRDRPKPPFGVPLPPVPIGVFLLESTTIPPTGIPLAMGSVWLYAAEFAAGVPANAWAGFLATSGALTLSGAATLTDGVIHIQPTDVLTLTAEIQPLVPATPVAGAGADATSASPILPTEIKIQFSPSGAEITSLSAFSLAVYGISSQAPWQR